MKKGLFVAFEGIDGCGKTTQVRLLSQYLEGIGIPHVVTKEPGGTPLGEEIRRLLLHTSPGPVPKAELLLYLADRAQHVEEVIRPALEKGKVVLSDRFSLSTLAYQCYGRGLSREIFSEVSNWMLEGLRPDVTFILDLPVDKISNRMGKVKDRMESEERVFFQRVREGFLQEAEVDETIVVLDASLSAEELHRQVVELVRPLLRQRG